MKKLFLATLVTIFLIAPLLLTAFAAAPKAIAPISARDLTRTRPLLHNTTLGLKQVTYNPEEGMGPEAIGYGDPVPGARVQIYPMVNRTVSAPSAGQPLYESVSNSRGEAYFNLPNGEYWYAITAKNYKGELLSLSKTTSTLVWSPVGLWKLTPLPTLTEKVNVTFKVILGGTNAAVDRAWVNAKYAATVGGVPTYYGVQGYTNAKGEFSAQLPANTHIDAIAMKAGLLPHYVEFTTGANGSRLIRTYTLQTPRR
jgi:hypothetical protein